MRRLLTFLGIPCVLALTLACGGDGAAEPTAMLAATATAMETPTATPTHLTEAPTATVAPTPTETSRPTPTLPPTVTPTPDPHAEALEYLHTAIDWIEENSIFSDRVDWERTRAEATRRAAGAVDPAGTHDAIRYVLRQLRDPHSRFVGSMAEALNEHEDPNLKVPTGQLLDGNIGYVMVPDIRSGAGDQLIYATAGVDLIRSLDEQPVCGWIVDLRFNPGGRGFSMIIAIGPLLGDGIFGSFTAADGESFDWYLESGRVGVVDDGWVEGPAYTLRQPDPPVAVLYGRSTASAGELVALAFRGRPDSRSFGQPTGGAPTAPGALELSDGAVIIVATARMVDRTGEAFDGPMLPDEIVYMTGRQRPLDEDRVVQAAIEWLMSFPECAGP